MIDKKLSSQCYVAVLPVGTIGFTLMLSCTCSSRNSFLAQEFCYSSLQDIEKARVDFSKKKKKVGVISADCNLEREPSDQNAPLIKCKVCDVHV